MSKKYVAKGEDVLRCKEICDMEVNSTLRGYFCVLLEFSPAMSRKFFRHLYCSNILMFCFDLTSTLLDTLEQFEEKMTAFADFSNRFDNMQPQSGCVTFTKADLYSELLLKGYSPTTNLPGLESSEAGHVAKKITERVKRGRIQKLFRIVLSLDLIPEVLAQRLSDILEDSILICD